MRYLLIGLLVFIGVSFSACEKSNLDKAKRFFEKHKIGSSPDYGIMKNGLVPNDHVATVHGFSDDYKACEEWIAAINRAYPGNEYRCVPLNH